MMKTELLCSVCEQRIEPTDGDEYPSDAVRNALDISIDRLTQAEKERDEAVAERDIAYKSAWQANAERDVAVARGDKLEAVYAACHAREIELQRDLDAMTADRDLWQDEHQDECPYFMELENVKRDLDAAKELLKEYMEDHECPNGPDDTQCQSTIKARNLLK